MRRQRRAAGELCFAWLHTLRSPPFPLHLISMPFVKNKPGSREGPVYFTLLAARQKAPTTDFL